MATKTLVKFLDDKQAYDMYITGRAGTGKTTALCGIVEHLQAKDISYIVCAFTHKACGVLRSKLPLNAHVTTLDSFLKKRPGINKRATKADHVDVRLKMGDSDTYSVIIIDEYSMVGEKDLMDLVALQDQNDDGTPSAKVVYVGDPYQLPPVKDMQAVDPCGDYWVQLTKVHRTDRLDLLDLATKLVSYIDGAEPKPLSSSDNFHRNMNLVESYKATATDDKILLAWTNARVQELNFEIMGKELPDPGDELWNATLRHELIFEGYADRDQVGAILTPVGELPLNTKFKTLEFLLEQPYIEFITVHNITLNATHTLAICFGTNNHKLLLKKLTENAVNDNKVIEQKHNEKAADWCKRNHKSTLAKRRAQAWRRLLSAKEAVCCVDFKHAMTIHKSQGSTYKEVYLDANDLARCSNVDFTMYARLFYVAITRASHLVVTN